MALLLFVCVLFWGAHKSLAPRARTLLGGLGQATLSFFAVATLLFFCFCECPKFCDLAKQLQMKGFGVTCPAEFDRDAPGDLQTGVMALNSSSAANAQVAVAIALLPVNT